MERDRQNDRQEKTEGWVMGERDRQKQRERLEERLKERQWRDRIWEKPLERQGYRKTGLAKEYREGQGERDRGRNAVYLFSYCGL